MPVRGRAGPLRILSPLRLEACLTVLRTVPVGGGGPDEAFTILVNEEGAIPAEGGVVRYRKNLTRPPDGMSERDGNITWECRTPPRIGLKNINTSLNGMRGRKIELLKVEIFYVKKCCQKRIYSLYVFSPM